MVARSTDNLDSTGDPLSHSVGTIATIKGKMSKRLSIVKGHFPKLIDCAHFHYENVDFGPIQLQFANDPSNDCWTLSPAKDAVFLVQVSCQGKTWLVRRTYEEFRTLDSHLHQCIYDRRYSQLDQLPPIEDIDETVDIPRLSEYLVRLSMIVDNKLNCGPVLTWMEIDNRGNQFLLKEEASLNVPAIGAAHVTKRYTAQANDEISIEVGDILSVIDMPPKEETSWWRGKHGFQVGFFPSECVELINERLTQSVSTPVPKQDSDNCSSKAGIVSVPGPNSPSSVSKKHGKLLGFLRTFMKSRPSKQKLKQRGILKERVFGCDLGEHLLNSGYEVPQVLSCCSEFIEKHGVVDGIYRHSGVSSNIQKLRHEFDSEIIPELTGELYMQDIHCVGSLCKLYFRELPNPLLTYQLYDKFADCMTVMSEEERLVKVHDVIQQLPPPHYRTLEFLMRHLSQLATRSKETNMHIKNLAIVWAPNLLRCKEIECVGLSGTDAFKEVRIQSVVVEFLLNHVDILFSDSFTSVGKSCAGLCSLTRPKSFVVSSLSSRLLSLEEAQARTQAHLLCSAQAGLLTLQAEPMTFQGKYHTVIDIPAERRKSGMKVRKLAGGSWRAFFAIGKTPGSQRRKSARVGSLFQASQAEMGARIEKVTLRSAKSEESLCSQHSGAGLSKHQRLRRPRSSSDALSVTMETELLSTLKHCRSYDSVQAEDPEGVYMLPDFSHEASLWLAEDEMDFSPTYLDEAGLELEPLTFRCGPQRHVTEDPDSLMNQSEVAVRKSFVNQPPQRAQSCCQQHKTSAVINPLTQTSEITSPAPEKLSKSTSFTRKVVHALSPKGNKSPPMDISEPISITVPAKVLEMIGGRAGEFQSASGAQNLATAAAQPPQMISMLLRSCDIQLTESCQQEIRSKLSFTESKVKGHSVPSFQLSEHSSVMDHSQLHAGFLMAAAPLPSQVPPPPPPKNPARLMALALAESANKAMKQSQREPRPQGGGGASLEARFMRSLSVDSNECLSSVANPLYSTVRSLSVWKPERGPQLQSEKGDCDGQKHIRSQPQESGTFSSQTSLSESGASTGSSSAETDSPYKPQPKIPSATACQPQDNPPSFSSQAATSSSVPELNVDNQLPGKKPPAYSRQFSAPHLQHKHPAPPAKHTNQHHHHHPQFHHSKCKSSPIIHSSSHLRAFQPARPKVPPKPPELNAGVPLHRNESYSRRSQDQGRPRMLLASQSTPPFSRNDSEGVCYVDPKTHSHLDQSRGFAASSVPVYHNRSSSNPQIFAGRSEDQVKHENFYYEIAPEPSFVQIPRYNYQNVGNQMAFEGVPYRLPRPGFEHAIADRHLKSHDISVRPHLWTGISQNLNPTVERSLAMQGNAAGYTQIAGVPYSTVPQESPAHQPSAPFRMVPVSRTEVAPNQGTSTSQRNLYRTQRSPSADLSASQLHPYFENGKVCYRYLEEGAAHEGETRVLQDYRPQAAVSAPKPPRLQEQPEPIYVNFPFNPGKAWTSTNLDGDQHSEPPPTGSSNDRSGTEPPLVFEENIASQESSSAPWRGAGSSVVSQYDNFSPSLDEKPQGSEAIHFRSKSDPGNGGIEGPGELQNLEEKDHVNHPTETAASESGSDGASRYLATLCEMPSHPQQQQHQHLQLQQHRAGFNVYATGPVRPQWDGNPFAPRGTHTLREEPLRRSSSSAGHYRQAFDVLPSGDQVLKFYRAAQVAMNHPHPRSCVSFTPNLADAKSSLSYSTRQQEPNFRPTYSNQVSMATEESAVRTPFTSMTQLSLTTTASPRGPQPQLGFNPGILRTQQYNTCQFNSSSVPGLPQYGNVPRREGLVATLDPSFRPGLRTPAGVVRQGSLPAPNWTVHSEGQTRSYC